MTIVDESELKLLKTFTFQTLMSEDLVMYGRWNFVSPDGDLHKGQLIFIFDLGKELKLNLKRKKK
jgi:hypothetical protein